MPGNSVVTREEWIDARKALLAKEKAFTQARAELAQERQSLPWVKIDKPYSFVGVDGKASLSDLFGSRQPARRLALHVRTGMGRRLPGLFVLGRIATIRWLCIWRRVMSRFAPSHVLRLTSSWHTRSGWVGRLTGSRHLIPTSTRIFASPSAKRNARAAEVHYNYKQQPFFQEEAPGLSVFLKNDAGEIYHTYSCFARGLDMINSAYQILDLVPKGRDEGDLPFTMAWVRRHDRYDETA